MGMPVLIYGKSGSGKSRSLKEFKEDEIILVQCIKKELPFRKRFNKTVILSNDLEKVANNGNMIKSVMLNAVENNIKTVVIDDAGYLMTNYFMLKHRGLKGNGAFELYNDIGDTMFTLLNNIKEMPDDMVVYLMFHEETDDYGNVKLRTIGKLLDQKVCLEGMVTICLRCLMSNGQHVFITNSEGSDIAKSPEELFDKTEIENDLKAVDVAIREYYGWNKVSNKKGDK